MPAAQVVAAIPKGTSGLLQEEAHSWKQEFCCDHVYVDVAIPQVDPAENISPKGARHETPCPCLLTWGLKGCCSDCTIDGHSTSEYAIECGTVNTSKNVITGVSCTIFVEHRVSPGDHTLWRRHASEEILRRDVRRPPFAHVSPAESPSGCKPLAAERGLRQREKDREQALTPSCVQYAKY